MQGSVVNDKSSKKIKWLAIKSDSQKIIINRTKIRINIVK
jgi:hypothetical protein